MGERICHSNSNPGSRGRKSSDQFSSILILFQMETKRSLFGTMLKNRSDTGNNCMCSLGNVDIDHSLNFFLFLDGG